MNYMSIYKGELSHHGILGQKWGIRRYQNPDGSLTKAGLDRYYGRKKIQKGTSLYRISGSQSLTPGRGIYAIRTDNDRQSIKRLVPKLAEYRGTSKDKLFEYELKTNKDLKVASVNDVREAQRKVINEHPEYAKSSAVTLTNANKSLHYMPDIKDDDDVDSYMGRLKNSIHTSNIESYRNDVETMFNGKKYAEQSINYIGKYGVWSSDQKVQNFINFGLMAIDSEIGKNESYQRAITEELKKHGFDAMYDTNLTSGKGDSSELEESLLLFDSDSITEVSKTKVN